MITGWQIYWITRLDNIGLFFVVMSSISVIGLFALIPFWLEDWIYKKRATLIISVLFFMFMGLSVLIPSTKEMAFIVLMPKIANSTFVDGLPGELLQLKELSIQYMEEKLRSREGDR